MSYQNTDREIFGLKIRVHLSEERPLEGYTYGIIIGGMIGVDVMITAVYDRFPANERVKVAYEVMEKILDGASGLVHEFEEDGEKKVKGYEHKEILLAVFSIINEAYLSYTEQLIMEAGKDEKTYLDKDGDVKSGTEVMVKEGKLKNQTFTTGNSHNNLVEIYKGFLFIGTEDVDNLEFLN